MEGKGIDHQSAMDLMTEDVGRLLPKLGEFLNQEHNLQTFMKGDIMSLERHLRRMDTAILHKMLLAQQDQLDPQDDKHCAYELRELSYIVNNLLLSIDDGCWPEPMANQDSCFRETLEAMKAQVKNLAAWQAEFVAKPTMTSTLEDGFMQARQLVGIHKLKAELISRMSSSSQRLKIVSIWAPGGMGKTTLAQAVYDNIKGEFSCSAFVYIGQQIGMKRALRDILVHLDKKRYSDLNTTKLNEGQLSDEIQHFLKNKRFLIIIDDIRDIQSWEVIKCALVDNDCGSRIITTSRVLGPVELNDEVVRLMPLSIDSSKELFYATLCGRKGTINLSHLDKGTIEWILQKFSGVPLAIIMLASLLAGKPQKEWLMVFDSIRSDEKEDITRKIIQFSYNDLPSHLKICLLFLSIFPENYMIEKDMLVDQWVAHGFVHDEEQGVSTRKKKEQGVSLFKLGERYLYELISRSMMQPVENKDASIRACRVEGMVLDWIRTVLEEENIPILRRIDRCKDEIRSLELYGSPMSPQVMPFELLRKITNDFSEKQRLGNGTFGAVYKGVLDGKEVAVKLLHSMAQKLNYEEEFMKEFENLTRLNHPNIVHLLGYCYEIKRVCVEYNGKYVLADKIYRALCFDYMHNGSLQRHLDDEVNRLDWPTCYKIIKGTCEGLKYLHEGSKTSMYHLDLKPGNILLDENMVPKIGDFGLSKLVCNNETRATSSFLGTKRYCPPEYIDHGYVSNKFDVFSLGVVMIELIAGSEGYSKAYEMPSQEFIDHVQENWRKRLQATPGCKSPMYECRQVQRCIEIALDCVSADRKQRPTIGDITSWLNEIEIGHDFYLTK